MFCDDGMGDGQTESASIGFCREIRIEDVGEVVFRYADSSVGYGDLDVFSAWKRQVVLRTECAGFSAAPDLSAQEHRVMGVEDQLVQGLCHLSMVNVDPLKRRGERNVARQLGASRRKLGGFPDEPVRLDGLFDGGASLRERQQLLGYGCCGKNRVLRRCNSILGFFFKARG